MDTNTVMEQTIDSNVTIEHDKGGGEFNVYGFFSAVHRCCNYYKHMRHLLN